MITTKSTTEDPADLTQPHGKIIMLDEARMQVMLAKAVEQGAKSALHLDNSTCDSTGISEGDFDMRHKAILPSGQWITGISDQELVDHALLAMQLKKPREKAPYLRDYAKHWFDTYKRPDLRKNTARDYWSTISKHIITPLGDKRLDEITTAMIKQLYTREQESGLAQSTLRHIHLYMNQLFQSAKEDKLIDEVPTASGRLTNSFRRAPKEERLPVSPAHIREIVQQLDGLPPREKLYLSLLIYTGMRREEALALKWEDIDFKAGKIHIERALTWPDKDGNTPRIGQTKSESGVRDVPLTKALREILIPHRQLSGYLICAKGTRKPVSQSMYKGPYGIWSTIQKTIPIIGDNGYTPHQFRHAYATAIAKGCKDIKILQSVMGHSDIRTTMRYNHMDEERLETARNLAEGIFLEQASEA